MDVVVAAVEADGLRKEWKERMLAKLRLLPAVSCSTAEGHLSVSVCACVCVCVQGGSSCLSACVLYNVHICQSFTYSCVSRAWETRCGQGTVHVCVCVCLCGGVSVHMSRRVFMCVGIFQLSAVKSLPPPAHLGHGVLLSRFFFVPPVCIHGAPGGKTDQSKRCLLFLVPTTSSVFFFSGQLWLNAFLTYSLAQITWPCIKGNSKSTKVDCFGPITLVFGLVSIVNLNLFNCLKMFKTCFFFLFSSLIHWRLNQF